MCAEKHEVGQKVSVHSQQVPLAAVVFVRPDEAMLIKTLCKR